MKQVQKFVLLAVLIGILFQGFFGSLVANAQTTSSPQTQSIDTTKSIIVGGISCSVGGLVSKWLTSLISSGLKSVLKFTQNLLNKIPGVSIFLNTNVPTDDLNQKASNVGSVVARCFARQILNHMTAGIIGTARTSGRNGSPAFVQDWRRFQLDSQRRGENIFRSILSSTELCPYFSGDIRTLFKANSQPSIDSNIMRVGNLDPYTLRARCTMPYNWSLKSYQTDFSGNGGYNNLTRLSQPQNNFYGNLLMSLSEVSLQRAAQENSDISSVIAGLGFDSRRGKNLTTPVQGYCSNNARLACTSNLQCDSFTGPEQGFCSHNSSIVCNNDSTCVTSGGDGSICVYPSRTNQCIMGRDDCAVRASNGSCMIYNKVLTPGSVLQGSVNSVINQELGWLTNVNTMDAIISDLTRLVLSRILNLSAPDYSPQEIYPREVYPGPTTPPGSPPCAYEGDADNPSNPGRYNPALPCPSSPVQTPDTNINFCDGTDADGDGNICDASIGEDINTCPSDCGGGQPQPTCGNGVIDTGEQCDVIGPNLNGQTCVSLGYSGGNLECTSNCTYSSVSCTGVPDSTGAVTACNDGTQTPTNSNVCLTAQWFKQGQAGAVDPTGNCASSNCVVLNHNIWDGSTGADIYRASKAIFSLPVNAFDYRNGTRVDTCNTDGSTFYGLATTLTSGINVPLNIPVGGNGNCPVSGVCGDKICNPSLGEDTFTCPIDCP